MFTKEAILNGVVEDITRVCDLPQDFDPVRTTLSELDFDSLDCIELSMDFELRFGKEYFVNEISLEEFCERPISGLVEYLYSQQQ